MSDQISVATVQQYTTNVQLLLQQMGSRLRDKVMSKTYTGKAAKFVEQIGKVAAIKRTTRHADTPLRDTPHDARWVHPVDYELADLIDDQDRIRMLIDPQSSYAINMAYAIGRAMDEEIIAAFFSETAKTGENGTIDKAYPAGQTIAAGGTGLTVAKLRAAKKKLLAAEVDVEHDILYVGITAAQHDNLLGDTQAVSLDYTNKPVLVDGTITKFMGFNFVHSELYGVDGASARRCPCWARTGMHMGIWNDITTRIDERPDKSYSTQVYVKGTIGATRVEEKKVVEILCTE